MMKLLATTILATSCAFGAAQAAESNHYTDTVLVANKAKYKPTIEVDGKLINAWGIAIRPAGAGGHFWVAGKDISFEYVGDVQKSEDVKLRVLHSDALKYVKLPVGGDESFATGVVFSDSKKDFVITQNLPDAEPITAPAKFIFVSDGGIVSAWTERKKADGSFDRSGEALAVIDQSKEGAQFFGAALSKNYDRLYVADFGAVPGVKVFDGSFKPEAVTFDMPFDENKNGKVDAGEYAPFNVQSFDGHVFVTYAKTQACPKEEIAKKTCAKGELFVGEEDTAKPGHGRLAEFSEDGKLVAVWNDGGKLSAPWGLAFAPKDFGAVSGALLVANFGDGTIAAYDAKTREFIDFMRDKKGKSIAIDKIWGLTFGNGASLGDADTLYYTAGPDDEKDGVFGSLRLVK
ncbi:MAG: TIGR03118 family protein [Alphaproteobacteria bacterium]|nr:TIGR03118 family protein [Alphaproteobacteria bacterium]